MLTLLIQPQDAEMAKALTDRGKAGVSIKVIGVMTSTSRHIEIRKLAGLRLHTRTIIRHRARREDAEPPDRHVRGGLVGEGDVGQSRSDRDLKRAVKAASADLAKLNPLVKDAVVDAVEKTGGEDMDPEEAQASIHKTVKEAVRERVQEIVDESGDAEKT